MEFDLATYLMSLAIDEADKAYNKQEVPVGCVIVDSQNYIIAKTHNTKEAEQLSCNHAEILAIKQASKYLKNWRLKDCKLIVSLEPCPMCMGAISQARIESVYFGAYDPKGGAISLGLNLHKDPRLNHKVAVFGGFEHLRAGKMLSNFFKARRKNYS